MARLAAWLRACGCSESLTADVWAALTAAGVRLTPFQEHDQNYHIGIICFTAISDELLAILRGARRDDSCRIITLFIPTIRNPPSAWSLLEAGASGALTWDDNGRAAEQVVARLERWDTIDDIAREAAPKESFIGDSPAWRSLIRRIIEAAHFTNAPILLIGESGTGKELLAKLVSSVTRTASGSKARKELVTVDCGSLLPELSGSELFGHERGAFTGAHTMRDGAFALADGATLLLDEIGDLPLGMQPQLLRSIQEGTFKKLGGNVWQSTNFRLVSATNRDLDDLVGRNQFRLDLYHRIAGCVFKTPPLRDRREDILPLAAHFMSKLLSMPAPEFDANVSEYLINRAYPGNIRELRQLIHRIAIRYPGSGPITAGDVPEEDRPAGSTIDRAWPDPQFEQSIADAITLGIGLKDISQMTAQIAIRLAVGSENGNLQRAASRLGNNRSRPTNAPRRRPATPLIYRTSRDDRGILLAHVSALMASELSSIWNQCPRKLIITSKALSISARV